MRNNTNIVLPTAKLSRKDLVTLIQDELTIDLEDQLEAAMAEFKNSAESVRQFGRDNKIREEYCGIYSLRINTPLELKEKLKELYNSFLSLASENELFNSPCDFEYSEVRFKSDGSLHGYVVNYPKYPLNKDNMKKYVSESDFEIVNQYLALIKANKDAEEKTKVLQEQLENLKKNTRRLNAQIIRNELASAGPNGEAVLEGLEKMKADLADKLLTLDKTKLLKSK